MRDVEKTQPPANISGKRKRSRKRNMSVYYFLVFALVFTISAVMCMTVLFSVEVINVEGDMPYSTEEIIAASGIEYGENLIRAKTKDAEKKVSETFLYIESVSVGKDFPKTMVISVEKCIPYFNIGVDSGYYMVSRRGKILDCLKAPVEGLINVVGFEPQSASAGQKIESEDTQKLKILLDIVDVIDKYSIKEIGSIDLTDIYNLKLEYDKRITIEAGSFADIDYKLNCAREILTKNISNTKEGYLIMNEDSTSFVSKEDMETYRQNRGT